MDFWELMKYLILGAVQGITEVLPISSSGHVELLEMILKLEEEQGLLFLILLNTGSLFVFLFVYRKVLAALIRSAFLFVFKPSAREENKNAFFYVIKLGIATIPAAIVGFLFEDKIDLLMTKYGGLLSGIGLLVTATVLLLVSQRRLHFGNTEISYKDAIFIGVAQSVALLPGVSRSGMTTSTALARENGVDSALKFSFLLYIPISLGSLILELYKALKNGISVPSNAYYIYYFGAFFMAVLFTAIAFRVVFPAFKSGKLKYFSFYCFLAGTISIILSII